MSKKRPNNKIKPNQVSKHDGVQILNNEVIDEHHIKTPTLVNDMFGIDIKDSLIDPDTKYYI